MNIALPALVILLLLMPGVIVRRTSSLAQPHLSTRPSFPEEIFWSIIYAILAHLIWCSIAVSVSNFTGLTPNIRAVIQILLGEYGYSDSEAGSTAKEVVDAVANYPVEIAAYHLSLCLCCFGIGQLWAIIRWKILINRKDYKKFLKMLQDEPDSLRWGQWCGLFETEAYREIKGIPYSPRIAVIVEIAGNAYLYRGFLSEVGWGNDGNPTRFEIKSASRRVFAPEINDAQINQNDYYRIPGKRLVIDAEHVKTMNIAHWSIELDHQVELEEPISLEQLSRASEPESSTESS